ncbi:TlpA disulfide reductase family protein [Emticicia sp. 21SJ11W-3]|uniref:TlpA family protein disulfide reductase n=1 Tax=Emticicia sp. 21SJ11W-3 TaxID=2916755 RepID=UPI0020A0526B|nr:TlpA disulfide reductase family protein [Emticicia sp. 21SJ11W-3]UTA67899.1 TlpA family protein disulfide reductase [Emticicia sp. 21SJ11W-3]
MNSIFLAFCIKRILYVCFYSTILFESMSCFGQHNFVVEGKINTSDGQILLIPAIPSDSIDATLDIRSYAANITNGSFTIKGELGYPTYPFIFKFCSEDTCRYSSDFFVVREGTQMAEIDLKSPIPLVNNEIMKNYYDDYAYTNYKRLLKDITWLQTFSDSIAAAYPTPELIPDSLTNVIKLIKENHIERARVIESNIYSMKDRNYSFWHLYVNFYQRGIQPGYEYFLKNDMSDSDIARSFIGKTLAAKLNEANIVGIGKKFPTNFEYKNLTSGKFEKINTEQGKYTLIDFWHSACGICVEQLREYKKIYPEYSAKGFRIISVPGDWTGNLDRLDIALRKYKFPWPEYLDENRKITTAINIDAYPANFLVDSSGTIIKKDLKPEEIIRFLDKNL